jgi:hypothetical protein
MFKNINAIIEKILTPKQKKEYLLFLEIKKKWKEKIPKKIQKNTKIVDYTNKTITIKAKSPTWKNELVFLKEEIKKNFQRTTQKLIKL